MKAITCFLLSASLASAAAIPSNADKVLSRGSVSGGNADTIDSIYHWKKRNALPDGNADNAFNVPNWGRSVPILGNADETYNAAQRWGEKRDVAGHGNADETYNAAHRWGEKREVAHGNADETLAATGADKVYNSYGWAK
jgi:hypothetical protein